MIKELSIDLVSVDHGPVIVYDLTAGDEIPTKILKALSDENITKKCKVILTISFEGNLKASTHYFFD